MPRLLTDSPINNCLQFQWFYYLLYLLINVNWKLPSLPRLDCLSIIKEHLNVNVFIQYHDLLNLLNSVFKEQDGSIFQPHQFSFLLKDVHWMQLIQLLVCILILFLLFDFTFDYHSLSVLILNSMLIALLQFLLYKLVKVKA